MSGPLGGGSGSGSGAGSGWRIGGGVGGVASHVSSAGASDSPMRRRFSSIVSSAIGGVTGQKSAATVVESRLEPDSLARSAESTLPAARSRRRWLARSRLRLREKAASECGPATAADRLLLRCASRGSGSPPVPATLARASRVTVQELVSELGDSAKLIVFWPDGRALSLASRPDDEMDEQGPCVRRAPCVRQGKARRKKRQRPV